MAEHELEGTFIQTLKESELPKSLRELADIGLDAALDNKVLQQIPIIGVLVALFKTGGSIRDFMFTKKLARFLVALSDVTADERRAMIERLEADTTYSQRVGESMLLLLERLDDLQKPALIAKAFMAYARGDIDSIMLQRINYAIDRLLLCDVTMLGQFAEDDSNNPVSGIVAQNFLNAGIGYVGTGYGGGGTHPNEVCHMLLQHVFR